MGLFLVADQLFPGENIHYLKCTLALKYTLNYSRNTYLTR